MILDRKKLFFEQKLFLGYGGLFRDFEFHEGRSYICSRATGQDQIFFGFTCPHLILIPEDVDRDQILCRNNGKLINVSGERIWKIQIYFLLFDFNLGSCIGDAETFFCCFNI